MKKVIILFALVISLVTTATYARKISLQQPVGGTYSSGMCYINSMSWDLAKTKAENRINKVCRDRGADGAHKISVSDSECDNSSCSNKNASICSVDVTAYCYRYGN